MLTGYRFVVAACLLFQVSQYFSRAYSNPLFYHDDAISAGMANVHLMSGDAPFYTNNVAVLGLCEQTDIGINYENRYAIQDISTRSIYAGSKLWSLGTGAAISQFGNTSFNEVNMILGLGKQVFSNLSIGVTLNYHTQYTRTEAERNNHVNAKCGAIYFPSNKWRIGALLENLNINADNIVLKRLACIGTSYTEAFFTLIFETQLYKEQVPSFHFGADIELVENFNVRAGVKRREELEVSFGLGYSYSGIYANVAFEHHPYLGYASFVTLNYLFGGR